MRNLMQKALTQLLVRHVFFATLALKLAIIESEKTQTMATDGKAIYYNPTWIATLAMIEILSTIAHEIMHVALGHHLRREGRDRDLWNQACDYAVNRILIKSKVFRLPEGALFDERFEGKTEEVIYNILKAEQDEKPEDKPEDSPEDSQGDSDDQAGAGEESPQPLIGEVWDATDDEGKPLDEGGKANAQLEVVSNLAEAQQAENTMGLGETDPIVKQLVDVNQAKDVSWYDQLAHLADETIEINKSYNTPDRRLLHTGLILAGSYEEPDFNLVIAWDSSGSLTDLLSSQFQSHINSIVLALDPTSVTVLYCDTRVRGSQTFERGDEIILKPKGGGGTRFDPIFSHIEDEDLQPDFVIYFTDGEGTVTCDEPDYPVVWATTKKIPDFTQTEFGESVSIY